MSEKIDPCTTTRYHDLLIAADVELPGEPTKKQRCLFRVSVDQATGSYATNKLVEQIELKEEGARKVFQALQTGLILSTLPTKPEIDGFAAFCYMLNINNLRYCTVWNEPNWSAPIPEEDRDNNRGGEVFIAMKTDNGMGKIVKISAEAIRNATTDSPLVTEISPNPKYCPSIWSHLRNGSVVSTVPNTANNKSKSYLVNLESLTPK